MCIIGCAPRQKLSEDISLVLKGKKEFNDLKKDKDYLLEETIFPVMFNPEEITELGMKYYSKNNNKILESQYLKITEWARMFVKNVKLLKNTHLFQGTMIVAEGTTKSPKVIGQFLDVLSSFIYVTRTPYSLKNEGNLRPFSFNPLKKGEDNFVIKIILVFAHNRNIKSYLYSFPNKNYSYVFYPTLTKKYLKQNSDLKPIDEKEGYKTIYLETEEDIPNLKKNYKKTIFLSRNAELLDKIIEKNSAFKGKGLSNTVCASIL